MNNTSHIYAVTLVSGLVVIGEVLDFAPVTLRSPLLLSVVRTPEGERAMFSRLAPYAVPGCEMDKTVKIQLEALLGVPYKVTPDVVSAYLAAVAVRNMDTAAFEGAAITTRHSGNAGAGRPTAPGFEKG